MILKISYKVKDKWITKSIHFEKQEKILKPLDFLKKYDILKTYSPIRLQLEYEVGDCKSITSERLISILKDALHISQKIFKNI